MQGARLPAPCMEYSSFGHQIPYSSMSDAVEHISPRLDRVRPRALNRRSSSIQPSRQRGSIATRHALHLGRSSAPYVLVMRDHSRVCG